MNEYNNYKDNLEDYDVYDDYNCDEDDCDYEGYYDEYITEEKEDVKENKEDVKEDKKDDVVVIDEDEYYHFKEEDFKDYVGNGNCIIL